MQGPLALVGVVTNKSKALFFVGQKTNEGGSVINPFYALELELFDFHLFRFSFGETAEEVTRK